MRPRSKLLSQKRRLQLPTIREGYEDLVRDMNHFNSVSQMNQSNTLRSSQPAAHHELRPHSLSSDDYLLSIRHLAHPTSLPTNDIINPQRQALKGVRPPQLAVSEGSPPAAAALRHRKRFGEGDAAESGVWSELLTVYRGPGKHSLYGGASFGCLGNSDPLEFLYGSLAQSTCQSDNGKRGLGLRRQVAPRYPHSCPSDLRLQRKSNLGDSATLAGDPSPSDLRQPQQTGEQRVAEHLQAITNSPLNKENQRCDERAKEGKEKRERERERSTVEHSLISQWISDCRCAWKEASVRACILPSVADT
ncbi:uncharacterized protein LOC105025820 [Esox lucius]|uniref:uncharacterized protein LOC105025820 n=1 Tax=Esox lucius TaxID=8010 RepID=UPI00147742DB|nr:uncharacterized protein LOC105025820 [Esox lucius]